MGSGGIAEAKREPEVPVGLNQLEEAIGRLADAVQGMGKRLEPVSRPELPGPERGKTAAEPETCPIAQAIRSFRYRVNNIREMVESQVARLEV